MFLGLGACLPNSVLRLILKLSHNVLEIVWGYDENADRSFNISCESRAAVIYRSFKLEI